MNVLDLLPATARFAPRIGPADDVILYGRRARYSKETEYGVVLREKPGAKDKFSKPYTWDEIDALLLSGHLIVLNSNR